MLHTKQRRRKVAFLVKFSNLLSNLGKPLACLFRRPCFTCGPLVIIVLYLNVVGSPRFTQFILKTNLQQANKSWRTVVKPQQLTSWYDIWVAKFSNLSIKFETLCCQHKIYFSLATTYGFLFNSYYWRLTYQLLFIYCKRLLFKKNVGIWRNEMRGLGRNYN